MSANNWYNTREGKKGWKRNNEKYKENREEEKERNKTGKHTMKIMPAKGDVYFGLDMEDWKWLL